MYSRAILAIVTFDVEDVITTSTPKPVIDPEVDELQ